MTVTQRSLMPKRSQHRDTAQAINPEVLQAVRFLAQLDVREAGHMLIQGRIWRLGEECLAAVPMALLEHASDALAILRKHTGP